MKTQLLRDLQQSIDMRSDRITTEEIKLKGPFLNKLPERYKEDMRNLTILRAEQSLAKKIMKRMIKLENIVTYMENNPK